MLWIIFVPLSFIHISRFIECSSVFDNDVELPLYAIMYVAYYTVLKTSHTERSLVAAQRLLKHKVMVSMPCFGDTWYCSLKQAVLLFIAIIAAVVYIYQDTFLSQAIARRCWNKSLDFCHLARGFAHFIVIVINTYMY